MFRTIVVPVDLTERNAAAVTVARELAGKEGRVVVLHVIETLEEPFEELKDFYDQLERAARDRLEATVEPLREWRVPFEQRVSYGKRVPEIVACAGEEDADLIVIGSHKADPQDPQRTLLTISHQVAMLAPCPVLVWR